MNISGRGILGILAGIFVAFALVLLAQYFGNLIAPGVYDPVNQEILIPLGATIALFVGWFVGSFAGSWLAMRMSGGAAGGWIVAGSVVGAAIYRANSIGEAAWVFAAALLLPLFACWLAGRAASLSQ